MGFWNTRGLRGSTFEDMINVTNDAYREKGLALIQKIPTPITPVELNNSDRTITLAYFDQKSTVDYIGAAQGVPLCFDAKETSQMNLPLRNIHEHQISFMDDFRKQKGLAFLLVSFSRLREYYLLPFETLREYYDNAANGGRKSIPRDAFEKTFLIRNKGRFILHYLEAVNMYLRA